MPPLHIEIAIGIHAMPSGGLELRLIDRAGPAVRIVRTWASEGHSISSAQLEDLIAAVGLAITEHFLVTTGVQLILHD